MAQVEINISGDEICTKPRRFRRPLLLCLTVFHVVCVILFWFVSCFGISIFFGIPEKILREPMVNTVAKYATLYLTNWNFAFQTIFLTMSLAYDALQWTDKHETNIGKKLKYYRDILFKGAVVPVTLFVSCMFWIVYFIDRELVFPKVYDQIVPWWFNHCVHTNISIVVLVETLLQERRHPTNMKMELFLDGFIGVIYAVVYYSIYFFSHRWLYGVFGIMNWWQVCLYQLLIWASMALFYFLQFPINRIFHREPIVVDKSEAIDNTNGITDVGMSDEKSNDLKLRTSLMEYSSL